MAGKNQPTPARRPIAPLPPEKAGKPGENAKSPETADGKLDASAAANPAIGTDPRATADKNALDNAAGRTVAAPPTPTRETAQTANDHPGEGGLQPGQPNPADPDAGKAKVERRKVVDKISATVPRAFTLTDDKGVQHRYEQGVQDMPREHAEHAYAAAHGVETNE